MYDARAGPLVGEAIHIDAIVVVERSLRDLSIFAGASPYLCTPVRQLEIFCRAYILTYCPDLCVCGGLIFRLMYMMFSQACVDYGATGLL